jgi:hypothetical protein
MISGRSAHYWLWFLLFGVISAIVAAYNSRLVTSETAIFLVTGFAGLLTGFGAFSRCARPYVLLIGLFFTVVGVRGIVHGIRNGLGFRMIASSGTVASIALSGQPILGL